MPISKLKTCGGRKNAFDLSKVQHRISIGKLQGNRGNSVNDLRSWWDS